MKVETKARKKGLCVICGKRVEGEDEYIESTDGYCHRNCLIKQTSPEAATA